MAAGRWTVKPYRTEYRLAWAVHTPSGEAVFGLLYRTAAEANDGVQRLSAGLGWMGPLPHDLPPYIRNDVPAA